MFDCPRPQALATAALLASLSAMLLAALASGAGAADAATHAMQQTAGSAQAAVRDLPSGAASAGLPAATGGSPATSPGSLIAALVGRLTSASGLPGPMQLAGRLIASPRIPDLAAIASASRAKLPPDLIALEQKMKTLHINSERGSIFVLLTGVNLGSLFKVVTSSGSRHARVRGRVRGHVRRRSHGHRTKRLGAQHALGLLPSFTLDALPLLTADFESSVSPKLAIVRAELLGAIPIQMREIGEQLYTRSPLLAELDGGRPWVYRSPAEAAEAKAKEGGAGGQSSSPSPIGEPDGAQAGFGKLTALLDGARSVVELGSRTVDGQATIEFEARLEPHSKHGAKRRLTQREKRLERAKVTLDLYLAPNGLPVRTVLDIRRGEVSLTLGLDIVATEIPIVVQPPPASETITGAELKKAEESSEGLHPPTKQEEAEQRRFVACARKRLGRHPGRASKRKQNKTLHECERIAKQAKSKQ